MEWIAWMEKIAAECIRVIKPGGHALVWAIPRTSHWTGMAWENAGWVPRDKIYHCFGSGFPKSHNIGAAVDKLQGNEREDLGVSDATRPNHQKGNAGMQRLLNNNNPHSEIRLTKGTSAWEGWGTALKPSIEEWWLFRKPLAGTVAENVLKHGTGGLNIDGCRVGTEGARNNGSKPREDGYQKNDIYGKRKPMERVEYDCGRWPANFCHDGSDEVVGLFPVTTSGAGGQPQTSKRTGHSGLVGLNASGVKTGHGDSGSAARFFQTCPYADEDFEDAKRLIYCGKASKQDRDEGCEGLVEREAPKYDGGDFVNPEWNSDSKRTLRRNHHPTVKPTSLMRYLCKLITPPGGTVLDPFMGSGSTGKAAVKEGFKFIGIEKELEYIRIANARIAHAKKSRGLLDHF